MLSIQNLSFYYGDRAIYQEASLHIKPKNRIGLVGLNGTGKTTLLKLIYGTLTPDKGSISKSKDTTLGFLNQDLLSYESQESILNVAMQGFSEQVGLQKKIDELLLAMEQNYSDALLEKLAPLQERFESLEGYTIKARAEEILEGLGFSTASLQEPLHTFSGGWRMRVMLAKLLLQKPSLLMLDEPTNHLDLPSIEWLENYLFGYEGAVIIVSHDQAFLDRAVNLTVEVSGGKLRLFSGNYSFYRKEKALQDEIQQNAFKNQQQKIKQTEQFISRFRAKATKAKQVQSRIKMLEKMDVLEEMPTDEVNLDIRFTFPRQPGKLIATFEQVSKAYGEKKIFEDSTFHIARGDKIALIGANGKGKSTLLRMVAQTEPFEGKYNAGYNVISAFYAQHQLESLHLENEILEELKQSGSGKTESELRNILGCFLFRGDDVFKKIKVLSGGEKSRVALAKTLISEANFLLLDEPTNHLDIQSVSILVQALQAYEGSYLLVSHDRHFIENVANKIWYIENLQLKIYPGTYREYMLWREKQAELSEQEKTTTQKQKKTKKAKHRTPDKAANHKKLTKTLALTEEKILHLEAEKQEKEALLAKKEIFANPEKLAEATQAYNAIKTALKAENNRWEELVDEIAQLEP